MQRTFEFIRSAVRPDTLRPPITDSKADPIVSGRYFLAAPRWLFLRLETASGIVGWGEGTLEGRSEVVAQQLIQLGGYLKGADSRNLTYLFQQLRKQPFYSRNCPVMNSAIAAVDTALWDVQGKRLGAPLYQLLGGKLHDKIRTYYWFGGNVPRVDSVPGQDGVVDYVRKKIGQRKHDHRLFFKMNALGGIGLMDTHGTIEKACEVLQSLKDEFGGTKIRFGIDCHGRLDLASAHRFFRKLEPFSDIIFFVEEPLPMTSLYQYGALRRATDLPIAMGERLYEPSAFSQPITEGWVSLVQPDVAHCLGVSGCNQIGRLADEHGVDTSYHCPNGPVSFAASLHLKAGLRGAAPQESSAGIHYNEGSGDGSGGIHWCLKNPNVLQADEFGFIAVPSGPGLGIEIDEDRLAGECEKPCWDETSCFLYDDVTGAPQAW